MCNHIIRKRRIENARSVELLPGNSRPDNGKDPRADHRADTKSRQRPRSQRLFQAMVGVLGVRNEFIDGLATQQLACQGQLLALEISP